MGDSGQVQRSSSDIVSHRHFYPVPLRPRCTSEERLPTRFRLSLAASRSGALPRSIPPGGAEPRSKCPRPAGTAHSEASVSHRSLERPRQTVHPGSISRAYRYAHAVDCLFVRPPCDLGYPKLIKLNIFHALRGEFRRWVVTLRRHRCRFLFRDRRGRRQGQLDNHLGELARF